MVPAADTHETMKGAGVPTTSDAGSYPSAETAHKPTDAKGWDGKLRLNKTDLRGGDGAGFVDPEAESEPEDSDEEEGNAERDASEGRIVNVQEGTPMEGEAINADEDLLEEEDLEEDDINLVHCRVKSIPALRLERFKKIERLCLRQNQISTIEFPEDLGKTLTELDLYDNAVAHIKGLDALTKLTSLDLSFNKIKHIKRLEHLIELRDLYFVQNKIQTIEGLSTLTKLRNLELGANRIREIQGLKTLTALEELWLGKNKITQIRGLDTLTNLTILSIQSNRLTSISGISHLASLEQLHISHNALTSLSGIENNTNLRTLDISNNPITSLAGLKPLVHLEELWASYCKIDDFKDIEQELNHSQELTTVYFEGNPVQLRDPAHYRLKVKLALPRIMQIDATMIR
ncbi:L domain-like protein [Pseudovirgaria hyperparasitica]|uniref:L domain-like protein n=1 Tax=Pseudovirgaria hyperparasitica TaxID=470096 RepID=A0A6A6WMG2_9PEZI|nr:L domain-like protein [Pseudovirgaria hyperparasitica]KAF2763342.1 L domain-like protein [Pseudovirgaria hyperparasitica]